MNTTYLFVAVLAVGYIGSRLIFTQFKLKKETEHLFLLGGEYILIGFLLGPSVFNVLSNEVIQQFSPVIVVGIGWLGLLLGNQISVRNMRRFPISMYKLLVVENLFFLVVNTLVLWAIIKLFSNPYHTLSGPGFWILLAVFTATSPTCLSLMSQVLKIPLRYHLLLRFISSIEGLIGIIMLGIIYTVFHEPLTLLNFSLAGLEWFILALFLGILGGLFFHWTVRESGSEFEIVLIIFGIVVYVGGLAYYLNLSALFVAFIVGIVMANVSHTPEKVSQILAATEKPFYIVFLIFAGALWNFQYWILFLIAPILFGIRALVKLVSTWGAMQLDENYKNEYWATGLGLSSLAGLALAIALEFYLMKPGDASTWLLGMIILIVLLNQIAAPLIYRIILPKLRPK